MQLQKLRLPPTRRTQKQADPPPVAELAVPHPDLANQRVSALPETDDGARRVRPDHPQRPQPRRIDRYQIVLKFALHNLELSTGPQRSQLQAGAQGIAMVPFPCADSAMEMVGVNLLGDCGVLERGRSRGSPDGAGGEFCSIRASIAHDEGIGTLAHSLNLATVLETRQALSAKTLRVVKLCEHTDQDASCGDVKD